MERTTHELQAIAEATLPIVREAGAMLLAAWRSADLKTREKARSDLVTEFDQRSEALIRQRLASAFPSHAFVGEEGGGQDAEDTWYVDPIDGTTNFAHGHPFFCIAMALVRGGVPVFGVTLAPALGLEWWAAKGLGSYRNGHKCVVSGVRDLEQSLFASGFPASRASRPENNYKAYVAVDSHSHGVRRCGAAALEMALVADGTYEGFWEPGLHAWDVASGTILVTEAGGLVTDFSGNETSIQRPEIVASNGLVHSAILAGISGSIPLPPMGVHLPIARDVG